MRRSRVFTSYARSSAKAPTGAPLLALSIVFFLGLPGSLARAAEPLVVHEWGTFTSFQSEQGKAIGGINSDDEPLPDFVHSLNEDLIIGAFAQAQGAPRCHPDVTMRLETPVIYFHLPPGAAPVTCDVHVEFHGGWLTQFYPYAFGSVKDSVGSHPFRFGHLRRDAIGKLDWFKIVVGGGRAGPRTDFRVWTAPRKVAAAPLLHTRKGESEAFLFYRGVGHLDAPIAVHRRGAELVVVSHPDPELAQDVPIAKIWLADFRMGGACGFRRMDPLTVKSGPTQRLASWSAAIESAPHSPAAAASLRAEMRAALIGEGLNADEADALLVTWEISYFKSPGLRAFFLVPRAWTDHYLPLTLSVPATIVRVMVGRLEIVAPWQRRDVDRIAALTTSSSVHTLADEKARAELYRGLGRFRNALVLDGQKRRPSGGLAEFIAKFDLEAFDLKPYEDPCRPDGGAP